MAKRHLGLMKRSDKQEQPKLEPKYDSISIVDMVKTAYEQGLFKKLRATDRKHAEFIDLAEIDAARLIGYFTRRPEFNREDNWGSNIHSVEFISDEFDIEIFDSFMTIYRLV